MRKLAVLLALAGAACGGGALNQQGVTGTVGGASFSPAETVAAQTGPAACPVAGLPAVTDFGALAVRFATFTGTCGDLTAPTCRSHKSSRSVTLIVARAATSAGAVTVGPGTYLVTDTNQFTVGASGAFELAFGNSTSADANCAETPSAATGSLRLDQVSASLVTGHVDVTFADGGKLQGNFIASMCPISPNACTVAAAHAICSGSAVCL